ncbi:MAG TPA: phosphoribosylglycinamide formyltransferase [Candidatus Polarisedimenticolaceae bacterium]|nr:phosphoribosylglycinamide formyltransferase [Candidatus Polarisedimenticolaceae bacterium]
MTRLAVLVSGTGSILESLLQQDVPVALVLADRPCRGLDVARQAGVPTTLVDRREFGYKGPGVTWDRTGFTTAVVTALREHGVGLAAMAGFMTILDKSIFEVFPQNILNTHPSLLPAFKGDNAVQDALDAGVKVTGCTIHYATADLDGGPIIVQREVEVLPGDTRETLHERIKKTEREIYPEVLKKLIQKEKYA